MCDSVGVGVMGDEEDEGIAVDGGIAFKFLSFVSRGRTGFLCGFSVSLPCNLYQVYVCGGWNEICGWIVLSRLKDRLPEAPGSTEPVLRPSAKKKLYLGYRGNGPGRERLHHERHPATSAGSIIQSPPSFCLPSNLPLIATAKATKPATTTTATIK